MSMDTTTESPRRLYKSRRNRMIDGVCGGLAEYFDVDPTIIRILVVLSTLLGGSGFILYIVGMIIMPVNPEHQNISQPVVPTASRSDRQRFWAVLLILVGALILITNLGWFAAFHWWHLSWSTIFPIILILIGIGFIYVQTKRPQVFSSSTGSSGETAEHPLSATGAQKELRRSLSDRKLFGVCGGIAAYFNIDSTIVRILYICLVIASLGWGLLLYIILTILMREEKPTTTSV